MYGTYELNVTAGRIVLPARSSNSDNFWSRSSTLSTFTRIISTTWRNQNKSSEYVRKTCQRISWIWIDVFNELNALRMYTTLHLLSHALFIHRASRSRPPWRTLVLLRVVWVCSPHPPGPGFAADACSVGPVGVAPLGLLPQTYKQKHKSTSTQHHHNAFDGPTLNCITPKNNKYRLSLDYTLRSKWNALPAAIRNISDYNMFKMRIKYFCNSLV